LRVDEKEVGWYEVPLVRAVKEGKTTVQTAKMGKAG